MRLLIIGCGSIGSVLATAADSMEEIDRIYLTDKVEEKAKAAWDRDADLRAEFGGNFNSYLAFDAGSQIPVGITGPRITILDDRRDSIYSFVPPHGVTTRHNAQELAALFRENPPAGQVFNPHWWGDWLVWDGPPQLPVFITTNMHLTPDAVWMDYRIVRETRSGWDNVLARYGVQAVVLDKRRQRTLLRYLSGSRDWQQAYEDDRGMVFSAHRQGPAGANPQGTFC